MAGVFALVAMIVFAALRGFRAAARERQQRAAPAVRPAPTVVMRDQSSGPQMPRVDVAFESKVIATQIRVGNVSRTKGGQSTLTW